MHKISKNHRGRTRGCSAHACVLLLLTLSSVMASAQTQSYEAFPLDDGFLSQLDAKPCANAAFHRTDSALYMPLGRNNLWRYLRRYYWGEWHYKTARVFDSVNIQNTPYWRTNPIGLATNGEAIDTVRFRSRDTLIWLRGGVEWIQYRFNAAPGDTWRIPIHVWEDTVWNVITYVGEVDSFYLHEGPLGGRLFRHAKYFLSTVPQYPDAFVNILFAPGFGVISNLAFVFDQTLYGAVIADSVYGDTVLVSVPENTQFPEKVTVEQNYPNPFNEETHIQYSIPAFQFVSVKVYDVLGRQIVNLVNESKHPGVYIARWNASNLPSGVYFYELRAGPQFQRKKMILLR